MLKNKVVFFSFIIFLSTIFIAVFNYKVDSLKVFHIEDYMMLRDIPNNLLPFYIHQYKNKKMILY